MSGQNHAAAPPGMGKAQPRARPVPRRSRDGRVPPLRWLGLGHRDALLFFGTLALALGCGLAVVAVSQRHRQAFRTLQNLLEESRQLEVKHGQLLIEQATFSAGQRIGAKAQELLAMHVPGAGDMIIVGQERDE